MDSLVHEYEIWKREDAIEHATEHGLYAKMFGDKEEYEYFCDRIVILSEQIAFYKECKKLAELIGA